MLNERFSLTPVFFSRKAYLRNKKGDRAAIFFSGTFPEGAMDYWRGQSSVKLVLLVLTGESVSHGVHQTTAQKH